MKVGIYRALGGFMLLVAGGIMIWVLIQEPHDAGPDQALRVDSVRQVASELSDGGSTAVSALLLPSEVHSSVQIRTSAPTRSVRPLEQLAKRRPATAPSDGEAIPGEWILRFKNRGDMDVFLSKATRSNARIIDVILGLNAVRVGVEFRDDLTAFMGDGDALFESAPNYYARLPKPPSALQPQTAPAGGYTGFEADAMSWLGVNGDRSQWGQGVKVAVLDSGVGQCSAINEDRVTRMDLLNGKVASGAGRGDHATAVATILAGGIPGCEGMAPSTQILSIRIVGADGTGDTFTLAKGIEEAIAQDVRIINLCVGSRGDCALVHQAINDAIAKGIVVVASVGNDGLEGVSYPAKYAGVVAVTAVDANRNHLYFANEGPEVGLSAPGLDIWARYSTNTAMRFSGTSASVPFVSGAIAGILSLEPGLKAQDAVALLLKYSDDAGPPGKDSEFGSGVIDPKRVLERQLKGINDIALADNFLVVPSGPDAAPPFVIVSVQNRGTERLSGAELRVTIGAGITSVNLPAIDVGETVGIRFLLPREKYSLQSGITVVSTVVLNGIRDDSPANNVRQSILILPGQSVIK